MEKIVYNGMILVVEPQFEKSCKNEQLLNSDLKLMKNNLTFHMMKCKECIICSPGYRRVKSRKIRCVTVGRSEPLDGFRAFFEFGGLETSLVFICFISNIKQQRKKKNVKKSY